MKRRILIYMITVMIFLTACGKMPAETTLPSTTGQVETTEASLPGVDDSIFGDETLLVETTSSVEPTTPAETEPPVTDATSPVTGMLTYESYEAMTEAQQIEFMESFEDMEAFFEWYNTAKAEYEAQNPAIEVGEGGIVDLDKIGQNDE